jgi:hypothetical protein
MSEALINRCLHDIKPMT